MVNPRSISSAIMLYQTCFKFKPYSNLLFLGYTAPETFDKMNKIIYQSLMGITIHITFESWICHIAIYHIDSPT
jgi:hypothetical protein